MKYILGVFIAFCSLGLLSMNLSSIGSVPEVCKYSPTPPRSGGAGASGLGDRTGSPIASGTCAGCHGGGSYSPTTLIQLIDGGGAAVTSYTSGQSYTIRTTVTAGSGTPASYGSQSVALTTANANAGSMSSVITPSTQVVQVSGRDYMEHSGGSLTGVFEVSWTAPNAGTGDVTLYGIGLAVDGTGGTGGDESSATAFLTLTEGLPTAISYPGTPFCSNSSDQVPVQTGETGGVFSAPVGLDINSVSGVINVANSTPGVYLVNYTYSQGTTSFSVTINPTYNVSDVATICSNQTLIFGTQTLDGTNAGLNTEVFQSVHGCDSTVNLTLTVNPTDQTSQAATICNDQTLVFGSQILDNTNAGLNTEVFQSVNGCDSTVDLTLIVEPPINDQVSLVGNSLIATQSAALYQWLDCDNGNAEVVGATSQSFVPLTSGNYSVVVTNGSCSVTSSCVFIDPFVGVDEMTSDELFIYPIPVEDVLRISGYDELLDVKKVSVLTYDGRMMEEFNVNTNSFDVSKLSEGIYFLVINEGNGKQHVLRFAIEK
ncbi:MAG: T9SS type A sorting domain-containing protein [Crocinitomicaceae bacterium]|nr:T9SS type A sorting domain-containing protein [Crocinitomicaceae bacterium]